MTAAQSGGQEQKPGQAPSVTVKGTADLDLDGTRWTFVSATLAVPAPEDVSRITLGFGNGSLRVSSGCNRGTTGFKVADGALVASMFAVTRMACSGALERWEPAFFQFLGSRPKIAYDGALLVLKLADSEMRFTRVLK